MATKYTPKSHFFSDLSGLADSSGTDGFGPVNGFLATKFRVTSKVKSNTANPVKLYAVCDGRMLIQPSTDSSKINIIIKPSANNYSPLKIKYFIYRGVKKSDYFTNDILNQPDSGKPETLSKIWAMLVALNGLPSTIGYIFPLSFVYDHSAPATQHIDDALQKSLVFCKEGDYIGNFTSEVGLDIVLDHGDYILENQEVLFNFNLEFAREPEFIFNTENISGNVNKKRYKEYIHQFLDAAAFWGSHIDCGEIKFKSGLPATTVAGVSPILKKYITGDKLYIYVQGEDNRTFNYFDSNRKIYGFETNGENNIKEGWPILIKDSLVNGANKIDFGFDYIVQDIKIQKPERNISVDCVAPNLDLDPYPITQRAPDSALSGKTANVSITFPKTASAFCASFAFFSVRTYQKFPVVNYFNHLWIANIKNSVNLDPANIKMQWFTYDRNRNINLDDTIEGSAIIQNKVIIDEGKNSAGQIKRRRLYTSIIKNNSTKDQEHNALNIDKVASGFVKDNKNAQTYFLNLFNGEKGYSIYRGTFTDNQNSQTINSLSVFHENSLSKRKSYLFLGITEDEYNQFPVPAGADNVFFDLMEEAGFNNENVRKFKLGLRYEDLATGQISNSIVYSNPNIFVYSIDDLLFFSKEFSEYQNYYNEFAKAKVEFRTIVNTKIDADNDPITPAVNWYPSLNPATTIPVSIFYNGEFGFDWLRIGDNGEPAYGNNGVIEGGYERKSSNDNDTKDTEYKDYQEAYKFLKRKYYSLPTQKLDNQYYIPYLSLFDQRYSNRSTNSPKPPFEATLRVLVEIDQMVGKLEFDYDPIFFALDKNILTDKNPTYVSGSSGNIEKKESIDKTIKITCLKDFAESKLIKIWAYSVGVNEKKLAGVLYIKKNNNIKKIDISLINVVTDIDSNLVNETGFFMPNEVVNLYNTLYQSLIDVNLLTSLNHDLTNDSNFKQSFSGSTPISNGFIDSNGHILTYHTSTNEKIHKYLKRTFNQFSNTFQVFVFDVNYYSPYILGHVDEIGKKLVVLYRAIFNNSLGNPNSQNNPRDLTTLNHEVMHGLGLYHTHREKDLFGNPVTILENEKKYIFAHAFDPVPPNVLNATDNVMSYNSNAITLWDWQIKILKL